MISLLLEPPRRTSRTGGRILAIEADAGRAGALRALLHDRPLVSLDVVTSVARARDAIDRSVPDLVLTSTFLPPADEAELTAYLKRRPDAAHVQVIIVPHFSQRRADESSRRGLLRRRSRASTVVADADAVLEQIDHYLEQARRPDVVPEADPEPVPELVCEPEMAPLIAVPDLRLIKPEIRLVSARDEDDVDPIGSMLRRVDEIAGPKDRDRRRAPRRPVSDVPWLWSARLGSGPELKLVDVSDTGVLVETAAKIAIGATVDLRLVGKETDLSVPARITRSEVSHVDALGVRYQMAAAFSRDLGLVERHAESVDTSAAALSNVLTRVLSGVDAGRTSIAPLVRFEQELAQLLPVRAVHIREVPIRPPAGTESVYFHVPDREGWILQIVFEPHQAPSAAHFRLFRAAAIMASVVLEFAPERRALQVAAG